MDATRHRSVGSLSPLDGEQETWPGQSLEPPLAEPRARAPRARRARARGGRAPRPGPGPGRPGPPADGDGRTDGPSGTVEDGEEPVAGRRDLTAAEAVEDVTDIAVVPAEGLAPGGVPAP